jgi:hypothetical protein
MLEVRQYFRINLVTGATEVFMAQVPIPTRWYAATAVALQCWTAAGTLEPAMYVFGGGQGGTESSFNALHRILFAEPADMELIVPQGGDAAAPPARLYHGACAVRDTQMYIFGGAPDAKNTRADDTVFQDLWEYGALTNTWRQVEGEVSALWPSKRGSVTLQFVDPYIYMIGGYNGDVTLTDAWRFHVDLQQWQEVVVPSGMRAAMGLWAYGCRYDPVRSRIHFYGGFTVDMKQEGTAAHTSVRVPPPALHSVVAAFIRKHHDAFAAQLKGLARGSGFLSPRLQWLQERVDSVPAAPR